MNNDERVVVRFLSRTEVATYLGMKSVHSLSRVTLPPHDAEVGNHKGWTPETLDEWRKTRPGRGRWGRP
jgi:hypothetical protein